MFLQLLYLIYISEFCRCILSPRTVFRASKVQKCGLFPSSLHSVLNSDSKKVSAEKGKRKERKGEREDDSERKKEKMRFNIEAWRNL